MPTSQRILRAIVDERRRALTKTLHCLRPVVTDQIERVRDEVEMFRAQAIVLNAKLKALELGNEDMRALRATLVSSTAMLDNAVTGLVHDVRDARRPTDS